MTVILNPVAQALANMKAGTGTFQDVQTAVANFEFDPLPPPPTNLEGLFDEEVYVRVPNSFRDTVTSGLFNGTLTRDQYNQLAAIAKTRKAIP